MDDGLTIDENRGSLMEMKCQLLTVLLAITCVVLGGCDGGDKNDAKVIRMGHFPNVTHSQALLARNMARHGQDWFEKRIPGYKIEWYMYNAGPDAMEAVFADSIDVTYVGPSPAINAYTKAQGKDIRIIAGAANGASALVVQPQITTASPEQLMGITIATPQLGNTQDVACRAWLKKLGFTVDMQGAIATDSMPRPTNYQTPKNGRDITIIPTPNPEQLSLFQRKQIAAVWTVEPWISRLEMEANGVILVNDEKAVTTVLAGGVKFLNAHPQVVDQLIQANKDLTDWIIVNPEEAQRMVVEELQMLTHTKISPDLVKHAWKRVILTADIDTPGISLFVANAIASGLISQVPDIHKLIYQSSAKAEQ